MIAWIFFFLRNSHPAAGLDPVAIGSCFCHDCPARVYSILGTSDPPGLAPLYNALTNNRDDRRFWDRLLPLDVPAIATATASVILRRCRRHPF